MTKKNKIIAHKQLRKEVLDKVILLIEKEDCCVLPDECTNIIPRAIKHYLLICENKEK